MQFKYPELLWALFLLLIPILIHLFQLRRFKKTPFTNVKFLKKVVSESRRSNTLKKWLILLTRLGLLAVLIMAFAQPFFAKKSALKQRETIIYLDNSFSMQAKKDNGTLLEGAVQDLLKEIPEDNIISLFTNNHTFKKNTLKELQNELLSLSFTDKQLQLSEILLKAKTLFDLDKNNLKDVVLISDFQQRMNLAYSDSISNFNLHIVQLSPTQIGNVSIDTIYIEGTKNNNHELKVQLTSALENENTPVSLFNGDKLIAKTSAVFNENGKSEVIFTLSKNEAINGKIEINDPNLTYDNTFYFNIDTKEKIKVLVINDSDDIFLKRIYTKDEFDFSSFSLKNLNYSLVDAQNLIILNELNDIPNSLTTVLQEYTKNGGSLTVIPSKDISIKSYNRLVGNYFSSTYTIKINSEREVSKISFEHPLFQNVFEKRITNFQYPKVNEYYRLKTFAPNALSFQDNEPFLLGIDGKYIFTASIQSENSNFKNSPLIVPTFYNMGIRSLKLPKLYNQIGESTTVDIPVTINKDEIIKVVSPTYEFIPRQKSSSNKVSLTFDENPTKDGIYTVKKGDETINNISFNYNRKESNLMYLKTENILADSKEGSIANLFSKIENEQTVTELWKWFVILALCFTIIEILLQKFL